MKGLLRFLPWWLVVAGLLLATAWSYRVDIARIAIGYAMDAENVENLSYTIADINFSGVKLDTLSAQVSSPDSSVLLQAENISLDYKLEELWQGKARSVDADKIVISSQGATTGATTELDIGSVVSVLASILAFEFSMDFLEIRSLVLEHDNHLVSALFPASLSMAPHLQGTKFKIANPLWILDVLRDDRGISANLYDQSAAGIANIDLSINRDKSGELHSIEGNLDASFAGLIEALKAVQSSALDHFNGKAALAFTLQPVDNRWQLAISGTLSGYQSAALEIGKAEVAATLVIPSNLSQQPLVLEMPEPGNVAVNRVRIDNITIDQLQWQPAGSASIGTGQIDVSLSGASRLSFSKLDAGETIISQAAMVTDLDISHTGNSATVNINPGSSFTARAIESGAFGMVEPNTIQEDVTEVILDTDDGDTNWLANGGRWRFRHPQFRLDDVACDAQELLVEPGSFSGSRAQSTLHASELECAVSGMAYPFDEITTRLMLDRDELAVSGQFVHAALLPEFSFDLGFNLDTGSGRLSLSHDESIDLSIYMIELEEILQLELPGLAIGEGELQVELDGQWNSAGEVDGTLDIALDNTAGTYEEISFSGLSINGPLAYPPADDIGSARINVRHVQYGAEIENIEAGFYLADSGIHFDHFEGVFLGSNIKAESFDFDPVELSTRFDLHVTGLDIARLVELQQLEGLTVTGKLDGILPVSMTRGEISIEDGRFTGQPEGGTINYDIDSSVVESISNPLTDTVIKALKDFSYDVLTAQASYQSDGNLYVDFHIEGSSPNLENGRPVHLNINSEQNLLSLLESLEYTSNLGQVLDNTIRNNPLLQGGKTRTDDETN